MEYYVDKKEVAMWDAIWKEIEIWRPLSDSLYAWYFLYIDGVIMGK